MKLLRIALLLILASFGADVAHAQSFPFKYDSAASTNSTLVLPGKVQVRAIVIGNSNTTVYWLKFYDTVTNPQCNTATVVFKVPTPGATNGTLTSIPIPDGLQFQNGFGFCLTANEGDSDNTNAGTGLTINFGVKQ